MEISFGGVGKISYLCSMNILNLLLGDSGVGLNTPLSNLDSRTIREIVKLSTSYCVDTFGVNKRKRTEFTVSIRKQTGGTPSYGQYCPTENRLTVFYNHCPRVKQLVQTVIHEYCHYLQPITTYDSKMLDEYGYDDHPMEVEAREFEMEHYHDCWKYVKSIL
jgi:hypothetical protein